MSLKTKILLAAGKICYKASRRLHIWTVLLLRKSHNLFANVATRMFTIDKTPDGAKAILTFIDENPM